MPIYTRKADLVLLCFRADSDDATIERMHRIRNETAAANPACVFLYVATQIDRAGPTNVAVPPDALRCSSLTREGIEKVLEAIYDALKRQDDPPDELEEGAIRAVISPRSRRRCSSSGCIVA